MITALIILSLTVSIGYPLLQYRNYKRKHKII